MSATQLKSIGAHIRAQMMTSRAIGVKGFLVLMVVSVSRAEILSGNRRGFGMFLVEHSCLNPPGPPFQEQWKKYMDFSWVPPRNALSSGNCKTIVCSGVGAFLGMWLEDEQN